MAATYPNSKRTYSVKQPGGAILSEHINSVQEEIEAIETQLITSKLATLTSAPAANNVLTTNGSGNPTWGGGWITYSPTLTFAGGTTDPSAITLHHARYTRIGKTVMVSVNYQLAAGGNHTTYMITLPITPANTFVAATGYESLVTAGTGAPIAWIAQSTNNVTIKCSGAQDKSGFVMFTAIYEVA
jgi:hypothetical protein